MVAEGKIAASRPLNSRQDRFAMILAGGETQGNAWKLAYGKPTAKDKTAHEKGCRLAADPRVQARVAKLKERTIGGRLLTVNDRLHLLSEAAGMPVNTAGERSARARCLDVYTKLAGGGSPEQHEVTHKGDPSAPIVVAVTVNKAPVRDRIAALRAAKEARG